MFVFKIDQSKRLKFRKLIQTPLLTKEFEFYSKKIPPVGVDNFRKIVDNKNYLYIEKTLMIKELVGDASEVILITRPRRWGKTPRSISSYLHYL